MKQEMEIRKVMMLEQEEMKVKVKVKMKLYSGVFWIP